jgi:hypothetical protein
MGKGMATIRPTLLQKLQALPPRRLAEVEAFVEFLAEREVRAIAAERLGESLARLDSVNLPPISDEEIEAARRERVARRD